MKRVSMCTLLAWTSFFLFFLLSLVIGKIANPSYYLLAVVGIAYAIGAVRKKEVGILRVWLEYRWVHISALGMVLAILVHEIAENNIRARSYDVPSHVALLGLLTLGGLSMSTRQIKHLRWAFLIGPVIATLMLASATNGGAERLQPVDFISIIAFSQLTLLLSIFAVFSIVWIDKKNVLTTILHGLTGLVGLYSIYISQTRGAWIAAPVFVVLLCIVFSKNTYSVKAIFRASILIILLVAAFSTTSIVHKRVHEAADDIHQYVTGQNKDTSVGTRFQLWKVSWLMFAENPVFGVGGDKFVDTLMANAARGVITDKATMYPHSHNEVLFSMATYGIFGLIGILATYFVPLYYFMRDMRHTDREVVATAAMGTAVCLGYFVFGLVDVMFMWRICDTFYAMSIAFCLSFIIKKKYELRQLAAAH
ncbi:O-antigen ligase family protein [Herbaspirillum rhizosphaerae]|uniref:O-antigen ligase family protein n=1 Tax=Herbaspirillum rhizosphaerae TaxID=346179 RepID=A0ABW8Z473_9BURK